MKPSPHAWRSQSGFTPYHFFYLYVSASLKKIGELCMGSALDLRKRFSEHNSGEVISTKRYMPWRLMYYEAFPQESLAMQREHRLKNNSNSMRELKRRIGVALKKSGKGFTIIEMIIVVGIITILAAIGVLMGFDSIARASIYEERDLYVSLLTGARARAIANVNRSAQGVHIDADKFVLFEDSTSPYSYDPSNPDNRKVNRNSSVSFSGTNSIIFEQLSANETGGGGSTKFTEGAASTTVSVNAVGRIDW